MKEFEERALSKKGLDFVIADLKKIVGEFFFNKFFLTQCNVCWEGQ